MCDYCSWIEKVLRPREAPAVAPLTTVCTNIAKPDGAEEGFERPLKTDPTILIHGTADSESSRSEIDRVLKVLEEAAIEAYRKLLKGAESADCAELAIRRLESQRLITEPWPIIRDAAMMESDSNAGSVGGLDNVKHPISLAKKVLRDTDHVLIVGTGVRNLENGSEEESRSDDWNEEEFEKSRMAENFENASNEKDSNVAGPRVYGALARDRRGRLSCGISTWDARVERTARSSMSATGTVIGCGIFADGTSCCSVSGQPDEAIYAYAPARKIVERLSLEPRPSVTTDALLEDELQKFVKSTGESSIGVAALSIEGEPRVAFETRFFPWASCNRGAINSGCTKNETFRRELEDLDMPLDCECSLT